MGDEKHHFTGWTIVEKLGEGGMCMVYRVRNDADPALERAVKVMLDGQEDASHRFAEEAKLLIQLDHPNVLKVFELVDEDPPWIVMDLLTGRDLEEHRDTDDLLSPEQAASWAADIAQGLQKVHEIGVVHRDLKPSNIMLGHDGVPRLIDFGVARRIADAHRTKAGIVVGTASYLPPELFLGSNPQSLQDQPHADVYALGQTLCELLINQPIHDGAEYNGPNLLVQIMKDKVARPHLDPREWVPTIPDGLAQIVIDATCQEPMNRIATAIDLETRLREWLKTRKSVTAAPVSRFEHGTLPPPPNTTSSGSNPVPADAPAKKGGGRGCLTRLLGLSALGVLLTLALGLFGLFVGGLALLWIYRPDPGALAAQETIANVIREDAEGLRACAQGAAVDLMVTVDSGGLDSVTVNGAPDGKAETCIRNRIERLALPGSPQTTVVPVRLKP